MATCRTCGAEIEIPEGWSVGAAARRHYWAEHPDRMLRGQADRAAAGHVGANQSDTGSREARPDSSSASAASTAPGEIVLDSVVPEAR